MGDAENNSSRPGFAAGILRFLSLSGPLVGLALVALFFAWRCPASFHGAGNVKNILLHSVIVSVAALGATFVIISGGIDLSVGSVTALAMVVTAKVIAAFGGEAPGAGLALEAACAGLGAGALCGLLTGLITTQFKIAPFIVTLGMLEIARGGAKWLAESSAIYPPSTWLNDLMRQDPSWPWYKLASGVWLMLALVALVYVVLKFTVFGRYVHAIGSNEQTARLCGLRVNLHRCIVYGLSGLFAGLAGVLYYGNLSAGDSTEAVGMELQVIAAVIIGGASLSGGEGNSFGTATGALIMVVLANGCTMLDVPMYVQNLIVGVVIIAAVGIDRLRHRIAAWNG